jgi:hypothetical protein
MSSPILDLCRTHAAGAASHPVPGAGFRGDPEAVAVAELRQAPPGWADLLAECAGLALGYGEHQCDAARYRKITELCLAAGVDQTLIEAWIEVGRQRASAAATLIHNSSVVAG